MQALFVTATFELKASPCFGLGYRQPSACRRFLYADHICGVNMWCLILVTFEEMCGTTDEASACANHLLIGRCCMYMHVEQ